MKPVTTLCFGNCLEIMPKIKDKNIDMVLADPPYEITACKWDSIIPLKPMWQQLERITKPNSAIVITTCQPFTTTLISSNIEMFKYEWIWQKEAGTNLLHAKKQPLRDHENVVVFYKKQPIYNPQFTQGKPYIAKKGRETDCYNCNKKGIVTVSDGRRYPKTILKFNRDKKKVFPTQKPVALMEYLIKTYTNKGDTVLDFAMGSGTTGIACKHLNRNFIGIEIDKKCFKLAERDIKHTAPYLVT